VDSLRLSQPLNHLVSQRCNLLDSHRLNPRCSPALSQL
jgi:hypothetical protein